MGSWNTGGGGGGNVLQTKNGGGPASSTCYSQWKITSMVNFLLKNMKFCTLVVHDLINYISYDAKLNRSKNCYFGGKTVKIL